MKKKYQKIVTVRKNGREDAFFSGKHPKGFTMIELIVSMFVFVVIVTASAGAFTSAFTARQKAREMQRNLEEARTAIDMMSKNIRMSTKLRPAGTQSTIYMFNNSQEKCVSYTFSGGKLYSNIYPTSDAPESASYPTCASTVGTTSMISGDVSGRFLVVPNSESPETIGKVTIKMETTVGDSTERIQTTLSLRDYKQFFYIN